MKLAINPFAGLMVEVDGLQPNLGWFIPVVPTWPSQRDPIEAIPMEREVCDLHGEHHHRVLLN